jgi:hypothetical protein
VPRKLELLGRPIFPGFLRIAGAPGIAKPIVLSTHISASEMSSIGCTESAAMMRIAGVFLATPDEGVETTIASLPPIWAVAPGCMAGIPMAIDSTSASGAKNTPLSVRPKRRTRTGISRVRACGAKVRGSARGAGLVLRLPLGVVALFVLPAMNGSPSKRGRSPQDGERQCATSRNSPLAVGRTINQVGKTVRLSIIFTKVQSYINEHVIKGDLVHVSGRLRQNSFERAGQRIYTVDLIAQEFADFAQGSQRTAA